MTDSSFVGRLKTACDGHPDVPAYGLGRQTWVKEKMQVSHEAVRKWFTGGRPRPAKMSELARLLGVDEAWLSLGVTPGMAPKERKARNAQAQGVVNVFMGLLQLGGGHCAFPAEDDPARGYVSLYAIRGGTQTSYHVTLGQPLEGGGVRFIVPSEYEKCVVVGAVPATRGAVSFLRLSAELVDQHGVRKGGYVVVDVQPDDAHKGQYVSGTDRWPLIDDFTV